MKQERDKLDRLLSSRLKRAVDTDGQGDWRGVCAQAGVNPALWHWSRRRVLLVAGAFVLAVGACAGGTGVIPWRSKVDRRPLPSYLPICTGDVVKAKLFLKRQPYGPGRSLNGQIVLVNTGKPDCALKGQPEVSLVGKAARATRWRVILPPSVFAPKRLRYDGYRTAIGRAFRTSDIIGLDAISSVAFHWSNWCGPGSGANGYSGKLALRFEVANGSTFLLPVRRLPGCSKPGGWSTLRFDRQGASPASLVPLEVPLRAEILGQKKGQRLLIRSGETFHYRVALTNTSARPFRFSSYANLYGYRTCPVYFEYVLDSEGVIAYGDFYEPAIVDGGLPGGPMYSLNCDSAKVMEPGETVVYEMEVTVKKGALKPIWEKYRDLAKQGLPIPERVLDGTTLGDGKLIWTLNLGYRRPSAEALVKVVP
jgi:hypothetical protein